MRYWLLLLVLSVPDLARADIVRSPLTAFDPNDLCEKPTANGDQSAEPVSLARTEIMSKLFKRYPVAVSFADLEGDKDLSLADVIANKVLGCAADGSDCKAKNLPDVRRIEDAEARRMRRALLRLFEASRTGSPSGFSVIANPGFALTDGTPLSRYQPAGDVGHDDQVLAAFIRENDGPYRVVCGSDERDTTRYGGGLRTFAYGVAKLGDARGPSPSEQKALTEMWTRKLALVKTPDDFAKAKPDGAALALVEGGRGDNIDVDATLGYRWQKSWAEAAGGFDHPKRQLTLTPYAQIDQTPVKRTFDTGKVDEDGDRILDTETIAYASYSFGGRAEMAWFGGLDRRPPREPVLRSQPDRAEDAGVALGSGRGNPGRQSRDPARKRPIGGRLLSSLEGCLGISPARGIAVRRTRRSLHRLSDVRSLRAMGFSTDSGSSRLYGKRRAAGL
ncbi:MAG: hypothetical protein WBF53_05495 [Litorimonas sp.]